MFKKIKKAIKKKDKGGNDGDGDDEWDVEDPSDTLAAAEGDGDGGAEKEEDADADVVDASSDKKTKESSDDDTPTPKKKKKESSSFFFKTSDADDKKKKKKKEDKDKSKGGKAARKLPADITDDEMDTSVTWQRNSAEKKTLKDASAEATSGAGAGAGAGDPTGESNNSSSLRRSSRSVSPTRSSKARSLSNERGSIRGSSVRSSRSQSPVRSNISGSARSNLSSSSVRGSTRGSANTKKRTAAKARKSTISKKSKWEEGLEVIDELLIVDSATYNAMTEQQRKALANVKNLLLSRTTNSAGGDGGPGASGFNRQNSAAIQHVPRDLILEQKKEQKRRQRQIFPKNQPRTLNRKDAMANLKRGSTYFILQEYAGMKSSDALLSDEMPPKKEHMKRKPKTIAPPPPELKPRISDGAAITDLALYTPQEFKDLPKENQQRLCQLLSWDSLGKWGFDIFELNDLTKGQPLLFMGWAVLGSPYAQSAMKQESWMVLKEETTTEMDTTDGSSSVTNGYPFMDEFKIPAHKLCNYLRVIQQDYHDDNPYHNAIHAADVVQALHCFIQMAIKASKQSDNYQAFMKSCPNLHLFAILLSAVIHDVDHPGKNNAFQMKLKTELAVVYNDVSVLENWHVACAFARMLDLSLLQANVHSSQVVHAKLNKEHKDAECNILGETAPGDFDTIRNLMIEAVLHTDMSKHFAMVDSVKGLIAVAQAASNKKDGEGGEGGGSGDSGGGGGGGGAAPGGGIFWNALMFMLHMADISNQAKPGVLARQWTDRCMSEFFAQGDQEANLGVPISPNCDRNVTALPESQVGFIKFVVQPAYEALGDLIPTVKEEVLPIVQANLDHWVKEKEIEDGSMMDEGDLSDDDLMSVDG